MGKYISSDGVANVRIIGPGWGSSGYYPADMLKRDGPRVFKKGLHCYIDHPTKDDERKRPERSVHELGGVLESDAYWTDHGKAGPGLYAKIKPIGKMTPDLLEQLAPHIGVSIRAKATTPELKQGFRDGRAGPIIEGLSYARSVDFVTIAGAGGRLTELMESALRGDLNGEEVSEESNAGLEEVSDNVSAQEIADLKRQLDEEREARIKLEESNKEIVAINARINERLILAEAERYTQDKLARTALPPIAQRRLLTSLAGNPPMREDGSLDRTAYDIVIQEAVTQETAYVTGLGAGRISGLGDGTQNQQHLEESQRRQERSDAVFKRLGVGVKAAAQ